MKDGDRCRDAAPSAHELCASPPRRWDIFHDKSPVTNSFGEQAGDKPFLQLPESPDAFKNAQWEAIAPYYAALASADIADGQVPQWLAAWSRLDALVGEAATLAMIAYTANTANPAAEEAHLRFAMEISPKMDEQQVRLARRLLETGYSEPALKTTLAKFRTDAAIFREENVPRFAQLEEIEAGYDKLVGGLSVEWDG